MTKTRVAKSALALLVLVGAVVGLTGTASARESSLNTKSNCYVWIGNVTKPTSTQRQVKVSVRCPFTMTVSAAYVGLWKDVSMAADTQVGSNGTIFAKGTKLAANTTYVRYVTWNSSATNVYGRFTFQVSGWTFPVVVESTNNT